MTDGGGAPSGRRAAEADGEAGLVARVEAELRSQAAAGLLGAERGQLTRRWAQAVQREPRRFIRDDLTVRVDSLRNFRRLQVFISDYGAGNLSRLWPRNWLDGQRRGMRRRLLECLETLNAEGSLDLLEKHPCPEVGNPYIFRRAGYRYTYLWHKHIHYLGLVRRILAPRLPPGFVALDIGSGFGMFSSLLRAEYPRSRTILVDFPEQLLLAAYYLGRCFPQARIAGVRELQGLPEITRATAEQYDFLLIPAPWYRRLSGGTADLITNFTSLGEMSRSWFQHYLEAPVFTRAQYFFTANRIQSAPCYDTDLTILDYPVSDPARRLYFGLSPVSTHVYLRKHLVFHEWQAYPSPFFEYIGTVSPGDDANARCTPTQC